MLMATKVLSESHPYNTSPSANMVVAGDDPQSSDVKKSVEFLGSTTAFYTEPMPLSKERWRCAD